MKTEYLEKHLSSDEMVRLLKNTDLNGERDHAHMHLKECPLCSEAYEGLKTMPDLSALQVLNAKWKLKSGIKPTPGKLEINLPALYTMLTLIGLISIAIIYFFFFNPQKNKIETPKPVKASTILPNETKTAEHYFATPDQIVTIENTNTKTISVNEGPAEGVYDEIKKPGEPLEKLLPVNASTIIPEATLQLIKGNSNEQLLNIEDFKIIDYTNIYTKNENNLRSFSEGLSARYETTNKLKQFENDEALSFSIISYEEVIARALRNYKRGNFAAAIGDFNFILEYFPVDMNAQFYKALCYKDDGQYQKAIDILALLAANNTHTFYQEAKWHLALSYGFIPASSSDAERSEKLLIEIINEGGFYKKQAIDEMKKRE